MGKANKPLGVLWFWTSIDYLSSDTECNIDLVHGVMSIKIIELESFYSPYLHWQRQSNTNKLVIYDYEHGEDSPLVKVNRHIPKNIYIDETETFPLKLSHRAKVTNTHEI